MNFLPNPISNTINSVDFRVCFAGVKPQAGCVPTVMQQGKINESAGVAFGKRSAVSLLQGNTGDSSASQSRYASLFTLQQWLVVDVHPNLRMKGNPVSTSAL